MSEQTATKRKITVRVGDAYKISGRTMIVTALELRAEDKKQVASVVGGSVASRRGPDSQHTTCSGTDIMSDQEQGATDLTPAEHRARHLELHRALDELAADYMRHHHNARPSNTTIMDLMIWSFEQTRNPTEPPE